MRLACPSSGSCRSRRSARSLSPWMNWRGELELAQVVHHPVQLGDRLHVAVLDRALHELGAATGVVGVRRRRTAALPRPAACWHRPAAPRRCARSGRSRCDSVPSPATVRRVSGGRRLQRLSRARRAARCRASSTIAPPVPSSKCPARVSRGPAGVCTVNQPACPAEREVERIAGVAQRAGLRLAVGGAVLGVADAAAARAAAGRPLRAASQSLNSIRSARKPGVSGVGDVGRRHVHRALLRHQAGQRDGAWRSPCRRSDRYSPDDPAGLQAQPPCHAPNLRESRLSPARRGTGGGSLPGRGRPSGSLRRVKGILKPRWRSMHPRDEWSAGGMSSAAAAVAEAARRRRTPRRQEGGGKKSCCCSPCRAAGRHRRRAVVHRHPAAAARHGQARRSTAAETHPADQPAETAAVKAPVFIDMPDIVANLNGGGRAAGVRQAARPLELAKAEDQAARAGGDAAAARPVPDLPARDAARGAARLRRHVSAARGTDQPRQHRRRPGARHRTCCSPRC